MEPRGAAARLTGVRLAMLVPMLLLAACGGTDTATPAQSPAAGTGTGTGDALAGSEPTRNDLVVAQDLGDGSPPQRWTLVCAGQVSGDHPAAQAACDHLTGLAEPFTPLPTDLVCTEVYGGPQTASVTGTWQGDPVDLELSRTDGCRAAQWDGLGPLLPGPVGAGGAPDDPQ